MAWKAGRREQREALSLLCMTRSQLWGRLRLRMSLGTSRLVCILIFTAACKSFIDGPTLGKTHILNKGVGNSCVRLLYFGTTSNMGPLRLLLRWRKQSYLKQRRQKSVWKECSDCSLCTDLAKGPSRLGVHSGGSFTRLGGSRRSLYLQKKKKKKNQNRSVWRK